MSVTLDVHYERDAVARRQRRLQLMLITIEPVGSSGDTADAHAGEDAGTVLEGVLHLGVDGKTGVLSIRDSLLFASILPHRFANAGSIRCLVLWAVTPFVLGQRGTILLRGQASAGRNVAAREGAFEESTDYTRHLLSHFSWKSPLQFLLSHKIRYGIFSRVFLPRHF